MSTATDGRRKEYAVRDHMIANGWEWIMRASASKGAADLLMGHPEHGGALVQVGSKSKRLGPADRARLLHAADLISALPILAVYYAARDIQYHHVSIGPPSTWADWSPLTLPDGPDCGA